MSSREQIKVSPAVIQWARKSAGYDDVAQAAHSLGVKVERLEEWEAGGSGPTIPQLRMMSRVYKRPLAVLLLSIPPLDFLALKDFRRLINGTEQLWSPALHAEFKRVLMQRDVMIELAEQSSKTSSNESAFASKKTDIETFATHLREQLRAQRWSLELIHEPRKLLKQIINDAELEGVLVVQTKDISIQEMRGFSISEWPFPVVALNGSDWPRAKIFTLLHELVHISLNSGGLCDLHEKKKGSRLEDELERYCNEVAGAALMPKDQLESHPLVIEKGSSYDWPLDALRVLSDYFGASSEAVLLRLISLGYATWQVYKLRKSELDQEYADAREFEKMRLKAAKGGPSYYVIKTRNLGREYVLTVLDAFHTRAISSLDVADYLDVRYDQLPKLERALTR